MSKITTYIKNGIEFRRCSKCQIEKENIYEFYRAKSLGRSGFRSVCRNCENDFVEKNMEQWSSGWRPEEDRIKIEVKQRSYILKERYLFSRRKNGHKEL